MNKTIANTQSVAAFIDSLEDAEQAADSRELVRIFQEVSGKPPVMWGSSIIGFGRTLLTYASGREVEWPMIGFSPRKGKLALYVTFEAAELTAQFPDLGKHTVAKGCIYVKKLADVNVRELEKLIRRGYEAGYQQPARTDGKEQIVRQEER